MKKILLVGISGTIGGIEILFKQIFEKKDNNIMVDIVTSSQQGAILDEFKKNGYNVFYLPSRKSALFKYNKIVKNFFKEHNDYDYIWVNTSSTSMYQFQYFGKKYTKAKIITHSHGTTFESGANKLNFIINTILGKLNYNKVVNNTDLFCCCSIAAGIALFGEKYKEKLILIQNGIDVEKYRFSVDKRNKIRRELGIADSSLAIGLVGRLSKQKNVIRAIKIFKEVLNLKKDAVLLIVGTGDLQQDLLKEVQDLKVSESVKFLGFRVDTDYIFSAIDVLLMPSIFEGLPLTGVEAQTAGAYCVFASSITKEAKLLDDSCFVHLSENDLFWAKKIISINNNISCRENAFLQAKKQGYDINTTINKVKTMIGE